jgi:serine protease Do
LIGTDEKTDLALLKVETPKPIASLNWGDSDALRIGDWVLAIGNPFGLGGTVTAGIVSARNRVIDQGPTTTTSRPTPRSTAATPAARCST